MNTAFLLAAQYGGLAVIPTELVARDYFELTRETLLRKIAAGEISLPLARMEGWPWLAALT